MRAVWRRQGMILLLLAAAGLGVLFCLRGLAATLRLGDAQQQGFLLVPTLPPPLSLLMLGVVLAYVGITVLLGLSQRRKRLRHGVRPRQHETPKSSWPLWLGMLVSGLGLCLGLVWLLRYGPRLHQLLERLRSEVLAAQALLGAGTHVLARRGDSPLAGYALFLMVLGIYGGLALLALWALVEEWHTSPLPPSQGEAERRRLERAVTASMRALHHHADPRQAIIACYARLEHLLADYGIPVSHALTPQEWMGVVLQDSDLPAEAFAGLVELFHLARYSLHSLDDTARQRALMHLETIRTHLAREKTRATPV